MVKYARNIGYTLIILGSLFLFFEILLPYSKYFVYLGIIYLFIIRPLYKFYKK